MKVLHHRCGYALRKFEQALPREADLLRPHFRAICHEVKRFIGGGGKPDVKWPRWKRKRSEDGQLQQFQQPQQLPRQQQHQQQHQQQEKQHIAQRQCAVAGAEEWRGIQETCIVGAKDGCCVEMRPLKAHPSDESTAAPTEPLSDSRRIRRPGRRARSRARHDEYLRATMHFARDGDGFVPIAALCSLLEASSADEKSDWGACCGPSSEDEELSGGEVKETTDQAATSARCSLGAGRSTLVIGSSNNSAHGHNSADGSSGTEPFEAQEHCLEDDVYDQYMLDVREGETRYLTRVPPIPNVGDEVWREIPMDAIGILQRHVYEESLADMPKDKIAALLSLLLEALTGRLQEPCRVPHLGDAGRAWDTDIGCGLAVQLIRKLQDERALDSTFSAFRNKVEALGKLADKVRFDPEPPAQMVAYGPVMQRFQSCVQKSWNWRWGLANSGEDPAVQDLIQAGGESRTRAPGGSHNPGDGLSSNDLQSLIQARLQASRQECALLS